MSELKGIVRDSVEETFNESQKLRKKRLLQVTKCERVINDAKATVAATTLAISLPHPEMSPSQDL